MITDDTAMLTCDECEIATIFRQDKTKNPPDPACPICGKRRSCSFGDDIKIELFGPHADAKPDDHKGCHNCGAVECWRCQLGQCRRWMPQPGPAEPVHFWTQPFVAACNYKTKAGEEVKYSGRIDDTTCETCLAAMAGPAEPNDATTEDRRCGTCLHWGKGDDDSQRKNRMCTAPSPMGVDGHRCYMTADLGVSCMCWTKRIPDDAKLDTPDDDCPRCSFWESGRVVGVFKGDLLFDPSDGSAATGPVCIGSKDNPPLVLDVPGKPGCKGCRDWTAKAICGTGELPQPPPGGDGSPCPACNDRALLVNAIGYESSEASTSAKCPKHRGDPGLTPADDYAPLPWRVAAHTNRHAIYADNGATVIVTDDNIAGNQHRLQAIVDAANSGKMGKSGRERILSLFKAAGYHPKDIHRGLMD